MSTASVTLDNSSSKDGILSLLIALFFFSFQDIIIKYLSDDFSILQLLFIRSSFALIVRLVIAYTMLGSDVLKAKQPGRLLVRGVLVVFVCRILLSCNPGVTLG